MDTIYGVLGGGQLAKYMVSDKSGWSHFVIMSPAPPLISKGINFEWARCNLNNVDEVVLRGQKCNVITIEMDNVPVPALEILQSKGKTIIPDPKIIKMIQNKLSQKNFLIDNNFPTSALLGTYCYPQQPWTTLKPGREVHKLQTGGYDGRGVEMNNDGILHNGRPDDLNRYFPEGSHVMVEDFVELKGEVSVIIGRNVHGDILMFEPSQIIMNKQTHMLDYLICPISDETIYTGTGSCNKNQLLHKLREIATRLVETMKYIGILAIEFFITTDNQILINEMSPRPHNSGHHTMDRYNISQNELLRMILQKKRFSMDGLKFKGSDMNVWEFSQDKKTISYNNVVNNNFHRISILTNIVGTEQITRTPTIFKTVFYNPEYQLYWYGKDVCTPGRKMGHLTFTGTFDAYNTLYLHNSYIKTKSDYINLHATRMAHSTYIDFGGDDETEDYNTKRIKPMVRITNGDKNNHEVAVIMGSSSDLNVVQPALDILNQFRVPYRVEIVSAHRTPHEMLEWAHKCNADVIIAAAGGAAHLPGMIASASIVPVVGIPVKSTNSINGIDSLLSICQMPSGIPVGTMAIDGAINAALYAIRILSLQDQKLRILLQIYSISLQDKVKTQNTTLPDYI